MNKQEIIDYLKGQTEWSGNHHYILVNKSELISMIEDLDELEFKNYLRDIKSQIDYLRIHGPGKIKSLRMLQNMVDNMITGCWSSTSIRTQKVKARLAKHWDEDLGDCLWWDFPVEEPPYCGTPLDDDFPKYKTHFTELHIPDEVEQEQKWKIINDQKYCLTSIEAGYGNSLHWAFDSTKKKPILFDNEETALYTAYITGGTVEKV
ncbi:hypothetical protein [Enterococcus avium]|uniref:hypothetical protein n=2 Tax=Enterococcus avium TaxID=33945 RepID=UPI0034D36AE2